MEIILDSCQLPYLLQNFAKFDCNYSFCLIRCKTYPSLS